jgi:hypothetical protein
MFTEKKRSKGRCPRITLMAKNMKIRTRQTDWIVLGGWTALLVFGQMLLPFSSLALQVGAVLWMCAGVFIVRKVSCLPLLLMTLPVFMVEIHRPWAWAQMVMAGCFLLRILVDQPLTRREWLVLIGVAAAVFLLSWPLDFMERLRGIFEQPKRVIAWQFFHPQAVWGMFSFRQTFDRSLIAALATLLVMRGAYFSTPRVAYAFAYAAVMALLAGFAAALIPWHEPHGFLGTTNAATFKGHLFQGAGTNIHYLAHLLVLGLPWLCRPLYPKRYGWTAGLLGLCVPVLWVRQRAMALAFVAMGILAMFLFTHRWRRRADGRLAAAPSRWSHSMRLRALAVFALSLCLSGLWLVRMDVADGSSPLRRRFERIYLKPLRSMVPHPQTDGAQASAPDVVTVKQASVLPSGRMVQALRRVDRHRADTWKRALSHARSNYVWRGAGAGTWAPFHRAHRSRDWTGKWYWAHTHNTYVDLIFEYGMIPVAIVALLVIWGLIGIVRGQVVSGRLWVFYLVGLAVLAVSQHLLHAFAGLCALIPALTLIGRAVRVQVADILIPRGV